MTLIACGHYPCPASLAATSVGANSLIDAANEHAWSNHVIMRSGGGSIRRIHFRTGAVTLGALTDIRVESPDTAGNPSGTLWGTTTNVAHTFITTTHSNILVRSDPLTLDAAVALGDEIIITIKNDPTVPGTINICRAPSVIGSRGFPYAGGPLSTNKLDIVGPHYALEYSDGYIELPPYILPGACTPASFSISTATNPDEAGLHFTAPFTGTLSGWWLFAGLPTGQTCRIALYEDGNDTPLRWSTIDTDSMSSAAGRVAMRSWNSHTTSIAVTAGSVYRVAFIPLSASTFTLYRFTAYNNTWFNELGLVGAQETSRNRSGTTDPDAATWTETSTQRIQIGVIYDALDMSSGGGEHAYVGVG